MAKNKCIYKRIKRRLYMLREMDSQDHTKTREFLDQTIEIIENEEDKQ